MSGPSVNTAPSDLAACSSDKSTARLTPMQKPAVCAKMIFMGKKIHGTDRLQKPFLNHDEKHRDR
jgi:hypothetical protein